MSERSELALMGVVMKSTLSKGLPAALRGVAPDGITHMGLKAGAHRGGREQAKKIAQAREAQKKLRPGQSLPRGMQAYGASGTGFRSGHALKNRMAREQGSHNPRNPKSKANMAARAKYAFDGGFPGAMASGKPSKAGYPSWVQREIRPGSSEYRNKYFGGRNPLIPINQSY